MFVSIPTRSKPGLRWATPMLFAATWLAYLWASTRSEAVRRGLMNEWGALSGGLVSSSPEWPCDNMRGLDPLSRESDGDAANFLD